MSKPFWTDSDGVNHYIDELNNLQLLAAYGFQLKWVASLNEKIAASWELANFADSGVVANEIYADIEEMDRELITSTSKLLALRREAKDRKIPL